MRIIELFKDFGDFNVDVREHVFTDGSIHGLIGSNGSGKSTLSKLIVGSLKPDRLSIDFGGLTPRDVTMTSQKPYMMRDTVYNNLVYPLRLRGIKPDETEVSRLLELCGLAGKRKAYARGLSSGQQQKLSIARALIFSPKLIIIDESLSNLDLDSSQLFEAEILRLRREKPVTLIIISHQLAHIKRLCETVHFMDKGRVLCSGTTAQMLGNPSEPELKRFLRIGA